MSLHDDTGIQSCYVHQVLILSAKGVWSWFSKTSPNVETTAAQGVNNILGLISYVAIYLTIDWNNQTSVEYKERRVPGALPKII